MCFTGLKTHNRLYNGYYSVISGYYIFKQFKILIGSPIVIYSNIPVLLI